jgi:hypothetical protein
MMDLLGYYNRLKIEKSFQQHWVLHVLELEENFKNRAAIAFEQFLFGMCVCNSS